MENNPSPRYSSFSKSDRNSLSRSVLEYGKQIFDRDDIQEEFQTWLKQKTGNQSGKTYDARSLQNEAILIIRSKP